MQGARSSPSAPDCQISRKLVRETKKQDWVVYAKKPFGAAQQIVNYLGRYTHRVAISSARLLSISEDRIVFRTRGQNSYSLQPEEFIRRFLLHVLPHQFFQDPPLRAACARQREHPALPRPAIARAGE
jgi:hypothetical protein